MKRMIYLMGLGLARARRAGMSGTSVTDAARRAGMRGTSVTAAARRTAMTAMFVMLAAMTAWAENVNVNYIDADGNQQSVSATVLTGSESELDSYGTTKWYVVNSTFSHEGQIVCYGNVNIILADGCKMTTSNSNYGIKGTIGTLTIYGQTNGNGTLEVTSTGSSAIYHSGNVVICGGTVNATAGGNVSCAITTNGNVTINGGTVNATASSGTGIGGDNVTINGGTVTATANVNSGIGIDAISVTINGGTVSTTANRFGIEASTSVTISGGKVTATGNVNGIDAHRGSGTITLGWTNTDDFIKASSYNGTVNIANGLAFWTDDTTPVKISETGIDLSLINGKKLTPDLSTGFTDNGDGTYTINNAYGWGVFCLALQDNATYNRFSGKTVTLANDITVTRMAGSSGHEFMGTFDGNKKTLTVNYSGSSYVAPFSYVDGATIQNLVVEGTISSTGSRAAGVIGETGSPGTTGKSYITNCVSSSTISGGDYTGGFSIGGNVEIEGCVFNGTINSSGDSGGGGFVGYSQSTLKIKNCLFAPKDGSSVKGTFYYNGTAGTLTNCFYTEALGTAQGKAPRSVTADDNVVIIGIDFTGDGGTYDVSGIDAHDGGGIDYDGTKYFGDGDVVQLSLGHADPAEGYMFSRYTVTGGGSLDDPTSKTPLLTMRDADQTIGAEYAPIPTATFAYGSGSEGWTISPDDATSTGVIPGTEVTVGYSGPHKVKSVTVKRRYNTLAELKTAVTGADATTLAELRKDYAGKVICSSGHLHPAKTAVPSGCTAAAVLGYIDDSGNCYAIALEDMEDKYTWSTIVPNSSYANRNRPLPGITWDVTAPEGASWVVATKAIYEGIFQGLGAAEKHDGYTYDATSNAFITDGVGGTKVAGEHWSTTKYNTDGYFFLRDGWGHRSISNSYYVRPVLAF